MKASPKIIQKMKIRRIWCRDALPELLSSPPRRGSGKSGRASQDAGAAVKKRKVIA